MKCNSFHLFFFSIANKPLAFRTTESVRAEVVDGYDCTFEQSMCGWTQGPGFTLPWFRERPIDNLISSVVGPEIDHTYLNATGYYATTRIKPTDPSFDDIHVSFLVSPRLLDNSQGPMCAQWWYMMHGTDNTEFNVYQVPNDNYTSIKPIWRRYGDHGRHWQYGQIQIEPQTNITRVAFEVLTPWSVLSTVSLDDLKLLNKSCVRPDFFEISCTFEEEHICGYSSDPFAQLSWTRSRSGTPSMFTGPSEGTKFSSFQSISSQEKNKTFIL